MSSSALPPEDELALLREEVASLKLELERARNGEREAKSSNGGVGDASTSRSSGKGDGHGDATGGDDNKTAFPPPSRRPDSSFWEAEHPLSTAQVERYCRQMLLPWFGPEGKR
jgi:hypothetical protein